MTRNDWFVCSMRTKYIKAKTAVWWSQMISIELLFKSLRYGIGEILAATFKKTLWENFSRLVDTGVSSCISWNPQNPIKFVKVDYKLEYYTKGIFWYFQKKFKQFHISMGYEYVLVTVFILHMGWSNLLINHSTRHN